MNPVPQWGRLLFVAIIGLTIILSPALSADEALSHQIFRLAEAGTRLGVSEDAPVRHAEVFADWAFPLDFDLGHGFSFQSFAAVGLGWIGDDHRNAVMGSLGPSFRLSTDQGPVSVVFGSAPTLLSRNTLGERNLGCAFQFTSHVGLVWTMAQRCELGYRIQHMSNANISEHNPGLNSHLVTIAWRF
jgi:hypothetical protein